MVQTFHCWNITVTSLSYTVMKSVTTWTSKVVTGYKGTVFASSKFNKSYDYWVQLVKRQASWDIKLLLPVALALSVLGNETPAPSRSAVCKAEHLQIQVSQNTESARRTEGGKEKKLRTKNKSHSPAGKYSQASTAFGTPPPPKVSNGSEAPTTRKSRVLKYDN